MLEIAISDEAGVALVCASGRIDSSNANELGNALMVAIDAGKINLVLDLSAVDYMSSAGLRELVAALKRVKRDGGDLRLAQPSKRVLDVLTLAGLNTIFVIYPSQVEALSSY